MSDSLESLRREWERVGRTTLRMHTWPPSMGSADTFIERLFAGWAAAEQRADQAFLDGAEKSEEQVAVRIEGLETDVARLRAALEDAADALYGVNYSKGRHITEDGWQQIAATVTKTYAILAAAPRPAPEGP